MKIGIFGGSFNPPTKMHYLIAQNLLQQNYLDKVIYVPTGKAYKYKNNLIENKYRYKMLKIMTKKNKNILVSNYELKSHEIYTYQTLKHFQKKYPKDEIYFICGSDNLRYIDKWQNSQDIIANYKLLIIKRDGYNIKKIIQKLAKYKDNIIVTDIQEKNISSTMARSYIKQQDLKKLAQLVDKNIIKYILKKDLYKGVKND